MHLSITYNVGNAAPYCKWTLTGMTLTGMTLTFVFLCVQENSRLRRGGDHTYQAAKALDFDSTSNASTITNTISDDNNSNSNTAHSAVITTEDDSNIMGPTIRRKWTEWVRFLMGKV